MENTKPLYDIETIVKKYRTYAKNHALKTRAVIPLDNGVDVSEVPAFPFDCADQQLIAVLYKDILKDSADENILEPLSDYVNSFCKKALTKDEYAFLIDNYKDVISYEFSHREDWNVRFCATYEEPAIVSNIILTSGLPNVFIANIGYGDCIVRFPQCHVYGYNENTDIWALSQIRFQAAGFRTDYYGYDISDALSNLPEDIKLDIALIMEAYDDGDGEDAPDNYMGRLYNLLGKEGIMYMQSIPFYYIHNGDSENNETIRRLVKDKAIKSISTQSDGLIMYCSILVDKCGCDAIRMAYEDIPMEKYVPYSEIDPNILYPSVYLTERPEGGIPLSEIVEVAPLEHKGEIYGQILIDSSDLRQNLIEADICHNAIKTKQRKDNHETMGYQPLPSPCILIDNSFGFVNGVLEEQFLLGYITKDSDKSFSAMPRLGCLVPKSGVDIRYAAAILLSPSVNRQLMSMSYGYSSSDVLKYILPKVLIPEHNSVERREYLLEALYDSSNQYRREISNWIDSYVKSVRYKKHALSQNLSAISAKFNALNHYRVKHAGCLNDSDMISKIQNVSVKDIFDFMSDKFSVVMESVEHIADLEYSFGEKETIDLSEFVKEYVSKHGRQWLNFSVSINNEGGNANISFPRRALTRIFDNIISNVESHGFVDKDRKDYKVRFLIKALNDNSVSLFVENNGEAIPDDICIADLLMDGVSTKLNIGGYNGIGCHEIDSIMRRFGGSFEIQPLKDVDMTVRYALIFKLKNDK